MEGGEQDKTKECEVKTLRQFINENQPLLASLGVFAALTALANQLPVKILGQLLSFFCLAATILLGMELYAQAPTKPSQTAHKLDFFKTSLSFILIIITAYWLVEYRPLWKVALCWLLGLIMAVWVGKRRRSLYRALGWQPEKWPAWKRKIETVVLFALTLVILAAAIVISVPANSVLDALKKVLDSMGPR